MLRRAFIFQGQKIRKYKPTHNDCNGIILIINRRHASSWMWQGPKPKLGEVRPQKFKHLLVIDFEATCGAEGSKPKPQEIIEFPCALLNANKGFEIEAIFHEYVRPVHNPKLTRFCTELTGITQVSMLLIVLKKDRKELPPPRVILWMSLNLKSCYYIF